jgi:hypothetical protein
MIYPSLAANGAFNKGLGISNQVRSPIRLSGNEKYNLRQCPSHEKIPPKIKKAFRIKPWIRKPYPRTKITDSKDRGA